MIDAESYFSKYSELPWKDQAFEKVENKLHEHRDVCAMLLLAKLIPTRIISICGADHDIVYFSVAVGQLDKVASPDDILTLVRCGVHVSDLDGCLAMFV